MLALALPSSAFWNIKCDFFLLGSAHDRGGLVLGGTQGPRCFSVLPLYSTKLRAGKMFCEFWKAKLFKIQCFLVYLHTSTALRTSGYSLLYLQSPMPCICTKLKPWIKGYQGLVPPVSPASPAQHRLTPHFPYSSHGMRSGFALRPLPSYYPVSVQNFYPTLVKREDARSGFTVPILICTYKTHSI